MHPHVHFIIIYNSQDMKTDLSVNGWMDKGRRKSCHMWSRRHSATWKARCRKTNTMWPQLPVESSKPELTETENIWVFARDWEGRKRGGVSKRVQTSSYEMNVFWGSDVHPGDCSQQYCVIHFKVAKKVNLKNSHHRKK